MTKSLAIGTVTRAFAGVVVALALTVGLAFAMGMDLERSFGLLRLDTGGHATLGQIMPTVVLALSLSQIGARGQDSGILLARLKFDQRRAGRNVLAIREQDAGDQLRRVRGDVDRALAPGHAQHTDLIRKLSRGRGRLGHGLTTPAARTAAAARTACPALVVSESDFQNSRQDHKPHQTRRRDNEKMAFEHATQSPRQQAVPLSGSWPLRK